SDLIDVNEMIYALNEGAEYRKSSQAAKEKSSEVAAADPKVQGDPSAKEKPKSFMVPANLDLRFQSRFKEVLYKTYIIKEVRGLITVKDQILNLSALQMNTMAANMATTVTYASKEKGKASLDFDFKLYEIDLSKLTDLFPVIDSLLPMSQSFEGKVNFRMKGAGKLDNSLGMVGPSLDAIARVEGDDLVILDGQTFQKIAKMLFFKNKDRNTIDKLEFAMVFKDAMIEVFPSVITVDRYKVAVGGQHKLDMTYDYHISILKSPMPFKAGIDITGTEDDLDFKITKAKYKHLFSTKERQRKKADSTLIRRKISVMNQLPFSE
ncbi:MAG: AsmA-like C-terminal region-containing protein, partial [Lutimonas sp.]